MNAQVAWLCMLAMHAGALLGVVWSIDRALPNLRGAWREAIWRAALFGCALTATVQAVGPQQSFIGHWHWAASAISVPILAPTPAVPAGAAQTAGEMSVRIAPPPPATLPSGHTFIQTPVAAQSTGDADEVRATSVSWTALLVTGWLLGALVALVRLSGGLLQLRGELARALPVARADALEDLALLAERAGLRVPTLLSLAGLPSPIAVAGARIVLPVWSLETLDRAQLRAMLAHELGHIARGDPYWKLLTASWRALLWCIPLAGFAQRRLDDIAELACDAFAATHTGDGRSLAECLATCAEHHVRTYAFELAPAMAARQSSLLQRIERLLEGAFMETTASRALPRTVAALMLGAAVFCLPAIGLDSARAQAPAQATHSAKASGSSHSSVSISSDDDGKDTMTISLSDDGHKFKANVDGKIAFNDDETDIAGIGGAGTATLEETIGGVTRRLELAEHGGKLERRYFVDRNERPLDEDGRKWMANVVLQLVRSGIGAQARAQRLYAKGGAERVLEEVANIPTDYVRGIYLRALMDLGKLTPAQVDRAVKLAGDMHTDYERRQALTAIFTTQAFGAAEQITFLHQALRFDSDYERAELLVGVAPRLIDNAEVRQAWLDAALKVKSDYERRRTLQSMLTRDGLDDAQLAKIIEASSSMSSDYEHRELLVAVVKRAHETDAVAAPYARSVQKIGSDYERREALLALLQSGRLGTIGANAVLDSAAQIHSSYECREVLVALARVMPDNAALHDRYREVARNLPDYERSEAERALVR